MKRSYNSAISNVSTVFQHEDDVTRRRLMQKNLTLRRRKKLAETDLGQLDGVFQKVLKSMATTMVQEVRRLAYMQNELVKECEDFQHRITETATLQEAQDVEFDKENAKLNELRHELKVIEDDLSFIQERTTKMEDEMKEAHYVKEQREVEYRNARTKKLAKFWRSKARG